MSYGYIWDPRLATIVHATGGTPSIRGADSPTTTPTRPESSTARNYYMFYDLASEAIDSVNLIFADIGRSYHTAERHHLCRWLRGHPTGSGQRSGGWSARGQRSYRGVRTGPRVDTLQRNGIRAPRATVTLPCRLHVDGNVVGYRPGVRPRVGEEVAPLSWQDVMSYGYIWRAAFLDDDGGLLGAQSRSDQEGPLSTQFSAEGDYLGSVRLAFRPARGRVWVQHGNIYTWVADELDVPYVVRAPLL